MLAACMGDLWIGLMYRGAMSACSQGVFVVVSVFLQFFLCVTIKKSLGMMLVVIQEDVSVDTWVLGSIFATVGCLIDLLAPVAGPIGKKFGSRPVTMVGGVMAAAGLIIASQASNVLQLALPLNMLTATGYCLINVLTRAELGRHFNNRHFALASGLAFTGCPFSLVTQPPLVQLFLNTYGWRGTTLLVGSISAHLVVCGALLVPLPKVDDPSSARGYRLLRNMTYEETEEKQQGPLTAVKSFCLSVGKVFDLSLIKDYNFLIVVFVVVVTRMTRVVWVIYFVPHAVAKGFSNDLAALMVTAGGVGELAGTLLVTVVIFKEKVTSTSAMVAAIILQATLLFIDPWMNTSWLMSANAVLLMAAMGAAFALGDFIVKEFFGVEKMASAYGWIGFFSGFLRVVSGFVPGWIYDHSGGYDLAFIIFGAIQLVSAVPLIVQAGLRYVPKHGS